MNFKYEVGALVDKEGQILHITEGDPGVVVFPQELIYQLHKANPGIIHCLAHTHPPGMTELSGEDKSTLKAQALWMYPFPARMSTITWTNDLQRSGTINSGFIETRYLAFFEAKETWIARGKETPRKFYLIEELQREIWLTKNSSLYSRILAEMSYE